MGRPPRDNPPWRAALPALPCLPAAPARVDVAVIGAGLTGLSAAYHLLQRWPGSRVVVLEASAALGAGASGRSTGMLSPGVGQSLLGLVRRLGPERARALYQASLSAVQQVSALVAEEGIECELQLGGQLVWGPSRAARRRLQQQAAVMDALGLPVRALDGAALERALRWRWPASLLADQDPVAALHHPIAGTLHPLKLVAGLAERVLRRGGVIYGQARVRALAPVGGVATRLLLPAGELRADRVVVATAGYSGALGVQRGRVLPVWLQALATEPLTGAQRDALGWAGREGVIDARRLFSYLRLSADDRVICGGGRPRYDGEHQPGAALEDPSAVLAEAPGILDQLEQELRRLIPDLPPRAASWSGCIGYVIDGLPVIGRVPGQGPQVVQALGWCGHGVALGTASGRWIAELWTEGVPLKELPWHRQRAPWVPTESLRRLAFRGAVGWMGALDRLEGAP